MAFKPVGVNEQGLFPTRVLDALGARYPAQSSLLATARVGASIIGWAGDSHVNGTGASNVYYGFRIKSADYAGGIVISPLSINGGVAGQRSDEILTRIPSIISAGAQTLFVLAGTNDAGQNIPLATFQANILAIKALADKANIPMVIGTVLPRLTGADAAVVALIHRYNLWLRSWAVTSGVTLAETFGAVVDRKTGYTRSDLNADGVHMNDAGHIELAKVIAPAIASVVRQPSWPIQSGGVGLTTDPLAQDANQFASDHWDLTAGYYPELSVTVVVPASTAELPAGNWVRFSHNNTSGSSRNSTWRKVVDATKWKAGDKLLFLMRVRMSDVGALNKIEVRSSSASLLLGVDGMAIANPGPVAFTYTVPSTIPSEIYFTFTQIAVTGKTTYIDVGAIDVLNLTTMGVAFNGF